MWQTHALKTIPFANQTGGHNKYHPISRDIPIFIKRSFGDGLWNIVKLVPEYSHHLASFPEFAHHLTIIFPHYWVDRFITLIIH